MKPEKQTQTMRDVTIGGVSTDEELCITHQLHGLFFPIAEGEWVGNWVQPEPKTNVCRNVNSHQIFHQRRSRQRCKKRTTTKWVVRTNKYSNVDGTVDVHVSARAPAGKGRPEQLVRSEWRRDALPVHHTDRIRRVACRRSGHCHELIP